MKLKLLDKLIMLSKLSLYGLVIQCFMLSSIWAEDISAQKIQSVGDVEVELGFSRAKLQKVFKTLEQRTDFHFSYSKEDIDPNLNITFEKGQRHAVRDVLMKVSKKSGLRFRQVNRNIIVRKEDKVGTDENIVEVFIEDMGIGGKITDENGEGLPGASVIEKGTTNGTTTDLGGNYQMNVSEGAVLVVSFVGYKTQEIELNGRSKIDIFMAEDAETLAEVVVVGYGTQKKANLTGAVAVLDASKIKDYPVTNTLNLLQGQMPGVQITLPGGQPGADQGIIRVRGAGSIGTDANNTSKNNPLILIDGVQSTLTDLGNLNPIEIDNMSVLKDAASSSIYGARAAGGVILVTTKRGTPGSTKVTLSTYHGIQQAIVLPEMLNSWDYAILKNEARVNAGRPEYFTQETIDNLKAGSDPDLYPNTKFFDELFDKAAVSKYDMSVRGGKDNVTYQFSAGYQNQDGIMLNQSAERVNLRSNLQAKISNKVSLGLNIGGYRNITRSGYFSTGDILGRAYFSQPLVPVRWHTGPATGEYAAFTTLGTSNPKAVQNPIQRANAGKNTTVRDRLSIQMEGNYRVTKGLTFKSMMAYTLNNRDLHRYVPISLMYRHNGQQAPAGVTRTSAQNLYEKIDQYQIDNTLTYEYSIENHEFTVLAGHSVLEFDRSQFSGNVQDLPGSVEVLDVGVTEPTVGGEKSDWALQSYFGRLNYVYAGKYLFEANVRYDGSSRFPTSKQYGVFPSFSAGWRLVEESFLSNAEFISDLKLRASWGKLGNQQIGNYPHAQTLNFEQFYVDGSGNLITGAAITSLANETLQWEETTTIDVGVDFSLLEGRLSFTADYFEKTTSGILVTLPLPLTFGNVNPPTQNAAEVLNKGWEFFTSYKNKIRELNYNLSANLSTIHNEVLNFNNQESINGLRLIREGEQINSFFGRQAIGIFQTQGEVDAHAFQSNSTDPGDLKFRDVDQNGIIDDGDRVVIGQPIPKFSYGFNLALNYKGFDLSTFFQGVGGSEIFSQGWGNDGVANPRANAVTDWLNRWTPENPTTEMIRIVWEDQNNRNNNSYWIRSGNYLRLKNIQIGYTFNQKLLKSIGVSSARLYFSGQNLLTFAELKNWDPEQFPNSTSMRQHPQTKVYAMGLNINF